MLWPHKQILPSQQYIYLLLPLPLVLSWSVLGVPVVVIVIYRPLVYLSQSILFSFLVYSSTTTTTTSPVMDTTIMRVADIVRADCCIKYYIDIARYICLDMRTLPVNLTMNWLQLCFINDYQLNSCVTVPLGLRCVMGLHNIYVGHFAIYKRYKRLSSLDFILYLYYYNILYSQRCIM